MKKSNKKDAKDQGQVTRKPNPSHRGGKGQRTGRRKDENPKGREQQVTPDVDKGIQGDRSNDPTYYTDPALAGAAANIWFARPFGTPFNIWSTADWQAATGTQSTPNPYLSQPGIMVINLVPMWGPDMGSSGISPINVCAQAAYSYVRHANSGSRNYDAVDLMTYLLGVGEVFSLLNWTVRLYATMNRYYPQNKYFAQSVVRSMGVDYDDFLGRAAQFNYFINSTIAKIGTLCVPGDMDYFKRKNTVYANLYWEDESVKDQLYLFNPKGFCMWHEGDETHEEGYLHYHPFAPEGGGQITFDFLKEYTNEMIQRLMQSEDVGLMSGDILKAYGSNIYTISMIPQNMLVMPLVHDYNVLYQIRNATVFPGVTTPDLHQTENKAFLTFDNTVRATGQSLAAFRKHACVMTSNSMSPTVDEVMESSRLMATSNDYYEEEGTWYNKLLCGTDVCVGFEIYYYSNSSGSPSGTAALTRLTYNETLTGVYTKLARLSSFKYHPTVMVGAGSEATGFTFECFYQDFDNTATIELSQLNTLHEAAMQKMLVAPVVALLR